MKPFLWVAVPTWIVCFIIIVLTLYGCGSALCGYHGSGCGYIGSNPRNMANMSAEEIRRELSK